MVSRVARCALANHSNLRGCGTWIFSDIKFQADMEILLTFMFVWSMVGVLWLLPAEMITVKKSQPVPTMRRMLEALFRCSDENKNPTVMWDFCFVVDGECWVSSRKPRPFAVMFNSV